MAFILALFASAAVAWGGGRAPVPQRASAFVATRASPRLVAAEEETVPAAPALSAFAARVDEETARMFGTDATKRVREAWARLDAGQEFEAVLDESHPLMIQRASSYIEGLKVAPYWEPATKFKWAKKLEQGWREVAAELREALADADRLEAEGSNVWAGAKNQTSAKAYGQGWKTLALCDRTVWDDQNAALFPRTCELLHKAKVPVIEAFFAKMPAGAVIGPHSDMCNFALTAHLGVDVPEKQCSLTVGSETREWADGKAMIFDTSLLHEAENRADRTRYILMMRVYHPELTATERAALQFIFDCLDEPELLSDREALSEYPERRRALEAASRKPWEAALAAQGKKGKKGGGKRGFAK